MLCMHSTWELHPQPLSSPTTQGNWTWTSATTRGIVCVTQSQNAFVSLWKQEPLLQIHQLQHLFVAKHNY